MQNTFVERQRKLVAELKCLVDQRAALEGDIDRQHAARNEAMLQQYRSCRDQQTADFEKANTALRAEYQKLREQIIFTYESQSYAVVQEEEQFAKKSDANHGFALDKAKRRFQSAQRAAVDEFEQDKDKPGKEYQRFAHRCEGYRGELQVYQQQAARILRKRRCELPAALPTVTEAGSGEPLDRFQTALAAAKLKVWELERRPAAQFLEAHWPFLIFLLTSLAAVWPLGFWQGWTIGIAAAVALGIVAGWTTRRVVFPHAQSQSLALVPAFMQALAYGEAALAEAVQAAKAESERKYQNLEERRDNAVSEAHAQWSRSRGEATQQHQDLVRTATEQFKARRKELKDTYQRDLTAADAKYPPLIAARERRFAEDSQQLIEQRQRDLKTAQQEVDQKWQQLIERWSNGLAEFTAGVAEMNRVCEERFPPWQALNRSTWTPPTQELPALRFGTYAFRLDMLEHGLPRHERLQVAQTEFVFPVALTYPECPSLLYVAEGDGRDMAVRSLQDVMLRLLTSLPPGKVRFTIIDPIGLGQNFSAFMHLADFDERLVASRIWTETLHINKRLADLTEHMENVIQKYLRNEFESIQQYNEHAGEVAEPFQILVIANFPANFSEEAARRLVSIASSGARCGVYTLITVDNKLKLPRNFDLADLQAQSATLQWNGERFCWPQEDLRHLPLTLEQPPDDNRVTDIIRLVGEFAKDANRVEVPFASVVPPEDEWWTQDSREEIVVPLGRAGATKLQELRLGKGTSQHVLMSGKTGSGKSTLLHAMITNLATHYSPQELEFYLIDFKKGVEFKAYAAFALPHARVIAIESEREFGISVLERLDQELKSRGDLFRKFGVQDVKGYRDVNPAAVMPRVLLMIDEFQEFFVKDDKISQDAALYMDRLVRQGRAFGIHVLLGSQTLAGAYTLARSTLGQMAVRIALQCSEADAHLILSDDNTAARLLSRPGEAIYNDANGLFEGNHPFQVVWLPDHEREYFVRRLADLAAQRHLPLPPPIVFEGNIHADATENHLLRACLESPEPSANRLAPRAWLGAAVAIKDPACVAFRRQTGSHLLLVGQTEQLALGILANCLISLAGELLGGDQPPPKFYVLDGQRQESPTARFWKRLGKQLPLDITVLTPEDASPAICEIGTEVERRLEARGDAASPIFLMIYNLARFRDLRKGEDYNFSFDENAASEPSPQADKKFATILREGPNFGVHALMWCDTFSNLGRWLDRQALNDVALRILFQMSSTDSANLMDSPEASRLGVYRALLYNEEQGEFEKFRPYGPPTADWIAWTKEQLEKRMHR